MMHDMIGRGMMWAMSLISIVGVVVAGLFAAALIREADASRNPR